MRRRNRWGLYGVGLVLVWLALVLSEWLPRPTAAERDALTALAVEPESLKGERDGFAAIWLMGFDVPEDQLAQVLQADIAAYEKMLAQTGSVSEFQTSAQGKFVTVAFPSGKDPALCELWKEDCLDRVRRAPEVARKRLAEFSTRLTRSRWLANYDHFHYAFTPRFESPIASLGGLTNLQLTDAALQYVDGHIDQAFATLCSDTASWRRFRSRSDMLIHDMVGIAQMSSAAALYANMLAEQPSDFSAPCPKVFAPLSDAELDQCASLRFEFLTTRNSFEQGISGIGRSERLALVLANKEHVIRKTAVAIGHYCQSNHRERIARRDPTRVQQAKVCGITAHVLDPAGCALAERSFPDYHDYFARALDLDARLRLLGAALWMRKQPSSDPGSIFGQRPSELKSPHHQFELVAPGKLLRMRNLDKGRGEYWQIPLLAAPADAASLR